MVWGSHSDGDVEEIKYSWVLCSVDRDIRVAILVARGCSPSILSVSHSKVSKIHPRTGHKGPDGEKRCSSTRSLTSAVDGGRRSTPRPRRFTSVNAPVPPVGPRFGLDWCGWSRPSPGLDPRTVQPVATRYTNWIIPAQNQSKDFIRNQETLAYLKDSLRRQPRQTLKCFQVTRMRTGYFTQGVITYLLTYLRTYLLTTNSWVSYVAPTCMLLYTRWIEKHVAGSGHGFILGH